MRCADGNAAAAAAAQGLGYLERAVAAQLEQQQQQYLQHVLASNQPSEVVLRYRAARVLVYRLQVELEEEAQRPAEGGPQA